MQYSLSQKINEFQINTVTFSKFQPIILFSDFYDRTGF